MASGHGEIVTRMGQTLPSMKMQSLKTFKDILGGAIHFATWPKMLNQQDSSIPGGADELKVPDGSRCKNPPHESGAL